MARGKKKDFSFLKKTDPFENWIQKEEIGDGSFGKVYIATKKDGSLSAACKICAIESEIDRDDMAQEVQILMMCDNKYVLKAYEAYFNGKTMFMFIELCPGGALDDVLMELDSGLPEIVIQAVMYQSFLGLSYMHKRGVIHRDIKAGNILLTDKGILKLADFGVSALNASAGMKRSTFIGTPYWMAPEVIITESHPDRPYDEKCDVWSMGITCIELGETQPPNHEHHPTCVLFYILKNPPPTFEDPSIWSKELVDFTSKCLTYDVTKRPDSEGMLRHPFLSIKESAAVDVIKNLYASFKSDAVEEEISIDIDGSPTPSTPVDSSVRSLTKESDSGVASAPKSNLKTIKRTKRITLQGKEVTLSTIRVVNEENKNILHIDNKQKEKDMNEIKRQRRQDTTEYNKKKEMLKAKIEEADKTHTYELQKMNDRVNDNIQQLEHQYVKDFQKKENMYMDEQKKWAKKARHECEKELKNIKSSKFSHRSASSHGSETLDPLKVIKEEFKRNCKNFLDKQSDELIAARMQLLHTKQTAVRALVNEVWMQEAKNLLEDVELGVNFAKELAALNLFQSVRLLRKEQQLMKDRQLLKVEVVKKKQALEIKDMPKNQRAKLKTRLENERKNYKKQQKNGLMNTNKSEKEFLREIHDAEMAAQGKELSEIKMKHDAELDKINALYNNELKTITEVQETKQKELLINCMTSVNSVKNKMNEKIQQWFISLATKRFELDENDENERNKVKSYQIKSVMDGTLI